MKNKGFTLVELVAVIALLGLLMAIIITSIMNSRESAYNKLNEEQRKSARGAAEMLAIDLDDDESDIYNCKGWMSGKCSFSSGIWTSATVTIDELKSNEYFSDSHNHCSGSVTITKSSYDYDISVDVNCK